MMRIKRLFQLVIAVICCYNMACTSHTESQKKLSQVSRDIGEAYLGDGNYTMALRELLKAQEIYADDPQLQNDLGLAYLSKAQMDIAINHFKRAIELKPDYSDAKNNLGIVYLRKQEWDAAIQIFSEAAGDLLYKTPHYPLFNIGWAYFNKKEYDKAEEYYLKSLEMKPDYIFAQRNLGRTYIAMERYKEAVDILEKAAKNSPKFAELHFDLATAYLRINDNENAKKTYQRVIEIAPGTTIAEDARKEIDKISKN